LFAFEDPTNPSQQLTWMVFPHGFRDSHYLFGQASPNQRLTGLATPRGHSSPICQWPTLGESTEPLVSRATESPLNFLASQGFKVSREKAQLCLPQFTYLGMILEGQICSLSPELIKTILGYPLPQTLHQLWAFWGVTGFCPIWILGYADLARPLYWLLKEAQQNSQSYLNGTPRAKRLSKLSNRHSNRLAYSGLFPGICIWKGRHSSWGTHLTPRTHPITSGISEQIDNVPKRWPGCLGSSLSLNPRGPQLILGWPLTITLLMIWEDS
jgi:hypothetical protein